MSDLSPSVTLARIPKTKQTIQGNMYIFFVCVMWSQKLNLFFVSLPELYLQIIIQII